MAFEYKMKVVPELDLSSLDEQKRKAGISTSGAVSTKTKENLSGIDKYLRTISSGFADTTAKVLKFNLATEAINFAKEAIHKMVDAVITLDTSLTEFRKVSDLTGDSLQKYINKAQEMGEVTAKSASQMIDASTQFKKSGFTDEQSLILAQQATLFQNIADSEISASNAASFLIATMKGFNIEASDTAVILDSVNEVANNFAISTTDISTALPKVAATMAQAGNSLSETLGLLTAGTELMPGQA